MPAAGVGKRCVPDWLAPFLDRLHAARPSIQSPSHPCQPFLSCFSVCPALTLFIYETLKAIQHLVSPLLSLVLMEQGGTYGSINVNPLQVCVRSHRREKWQWLWSHCTMITVATHGEYRTARKKMARVDWSPELMNSYETSVSHPEQQHSIEIVSGL